MTLLLEEVGRIVQAMAPRGVFLSVREEDGGLEFVVRRGRGDFAHVARSYAELEDVARAQKRGALSGFLRQRVELAMALLVQSPERAQLALFARGAP